MKTITLTGELKFGGVVKTAQFEVKETDLLSLTAIQQLNERQAAEFCGCDRKTFRIRARSVGVKTNAFGKYPLPRVQEMILGLSQRRQPNRNFPQ